MPVVTNDGSELHPRTDADGPALEFEFPGFSVGVAEYAEGPTGCTVFHFPKGATVAMDVRGGASGTTMSDEFSFRHAICLAGGSLYGLEAASGVAAELFAMSGHSTQWDKIPLVTGAIVYDFGPRNNAIYPDKALGRAALRAAREGRFPLGRRGAGISATVGKAIGYDKGELSGQGGAFRQIGPTKLAAFSVVNAMGAIVDRQGDVVRGHFDRATGERRHLLDDVEARVAAGAPQPVAPGGNTTLTVVITNERLSPMQQTQLGREVHAAMARAIQPFHTQSDGDVLFTVTTGEVSNPALQAGLGVIASELAWDAVLSSFEPS